MTQRDKTMAKGLVALVALVGGAGLLYVFALSPVTEASARVQASQYQLDKKSAELDAEQAQMKAILTVNPRVGQWSQISLSPRDPGVAKTGQKMTDAQRLKHQEFLRGDYQSYLGDLLRKSRFSSVTISAKPIEKQATVKGAKQPPFEKLTFMAEARGELKNVAALLEDFHRTPLLHQMRSITLESAASKDKKSPEGDLVVKMNVEALLVAGAKDRTSLQPPKLDMPLKVLAEPARNYDLISARNLFTGIKPPPPPQKERLPSPLEEKPPEKPPETPRKKTEDPRDVLSHVKLTMIWLNPDLSRWEATYWNQNEGPVEKKLNTGIYKKLLVRDKYEERSLDAEVVHIDAESLVFVADKKHYRLRCGETVWDAMNNKPLSAVELRDLGLAP